MKMKAGKGFTLIEIIIVVVILGVLASIALPRLTGQINKARAAEAFNALGMLMGKISECYVLESDNITKCNTVANITASTGYIFPVSTNFTYLFDATTCTAAAACGATATSLIGTGAVTFTINLTNGAVDRAFTGDFSSLEK